MQLDYLLCGFAFEHSARLFPRHRAVWFGHFVLCEFYDSVNGVVKIFALLLRPAARHFEQARRAADSLDVSIRASSEHAAKNIEQATEILRRFFIRHIRFYNRNLYAL